MVIDVCTINDEIDIWEVHYKTLFDYVDEFIVVEFDKTFSGKNKQPLGLREDIWFDPIAQWPKVRYFLLNENDYEKYRELAENSPNTIGAEHWKREFMQKESIKDCLTHLQDDDIVLIGDVDEVWEPFCVRYLDERIKPFKLKLRVYTYFLNLSSSEEFHGTLVSPMKYIKNACLNHLRSDANRSSDYCGWHFTSMAQNLKKKLTDSYTHESYATPLVLENLEYNIANGKDFLGRDFIYKVDESEWPEYLKENRGKYQHLLYEKEPSMRTEESI